MQSSSPSSDSSLLTAPTIPPYNPQMNMYDHYSVFSAPLYPMAQGEQNTTTTTTSQSDQQQQPPSLYPPVHMPMHMPYGQIYGQPPQPIMIHGQYYAPVPVAMVPPYLVHQPPSYSDPEQGSLPLSVPVPLPTAQLVYQPPSALPLSTPTSPSSPVPAIVGPPVDEKHAIRLGNFMFVGSTGKLRAMEIGENDVMRVVWSDDMKGTGYHMVHVFLSIGRGLLYAATNGHIFCYEALTGHKVWAVAPSSQFGLFESDLVTLVCTEDGSMVISASSNSIVALNAFDGSYLWQCSLDKITGKYSAFVIVEHKGLIIVGNAGHVYALNRYTGAVAWKNGLSGYGFAPVSLAAYTFSAHGSYSCDILFIGTHGYVIAMDAQTGKVRHEVNLQGTGFHPVALLIDKEGDVLFAATHGELRCFKTESMKEIWKSNLPGMGYSFGQSLLFHGNHIIVGMSGKVTAVDKTTGKEMWLTSLPGCGYGLVTVGKMQAPNMLLCGSSGKLYGVHKTDGRAVFKDQLSGLGYSEITLSTCVFNTDFSSTTLPHYIEVCRENRKHHH